MRVRQLIVGAAAAAVLTGAATGAALADAHTVSDQRVLIMKGIAGHMKALGAVAKGEAAADAATAVHGQAIQELALSVRFLWPEGSGGANTRAKDEIWQQWDKFMAASDAFKDAAPQLAAAAKTGDRGQIGAALGAVGKTCGGCHKPFRKPKPN